MVCAMHSGHTECCAVRCQMQWEVTMGLPKPGEGCTATDTLPFFAVITAEAQRKSTNVKLVFSY